MRTLKKKRHIFKQERSVDHHYKYASELAKLVVERAYPPEDVAVLRLLKRNMDNLVMLLQKINVFILHTIEDLDDEGDTKETKSHFDFGLFGNLNGSEYSNDEGKEFAVAYFREDLKAMDCNPDIFAQQSENKDNPHKTKHVEACMKALGYNGHSYNGDSE